MSDSTDCTTCGNEIPFDVPMDLPEGVGFQCTNCWEVEHRLELYLRSEIGRRIVRAALEVAG